MALRIELDGDKPGIAKFLAQKWRGSADIDMLIQRNQDGYYLADNNQWGPEKSWHTVPNMVVDNEKIEGQVSAWLVDSLLSQESHVRFLIQVRDNQNATYTDGGVVNIAETVLASSALDAFATSRINSSIVEESVQTVNDTAPAIEEEITPLVEEIIIENVKEDIINETVVATPEIEIPPEPAKPKRKIGLIAIIVIVLLILAGLAWYFLFNQKPTEPTTPVTPQAQQNSACNLNSSGSDELAFIQQCLQSKPDTQAILQLVNDAKSAQKCNIAQRLYANQAQQNATIAVTYAKEYDEKFYQANDCFKADKETAIYWYETAITNEPNNTLAKERLAELQK